MNIIDQAVTYADAVSDDGIDYGTGYYITKRYSNGSSEYYGPFNYEEDARSLITTY